MGQAMRYPYRLNEFGARHVHHELPVGEDIPGGPMLDVAAYRQHGWIQRHHRNPALWSHVTSAVIVARGNQNYLPDQRRRMPGTLAGSDVGLFLRSRHLRRVNARRGLRVLSPEETLRLSMLHRTCFWLLKSCGGNRRQGPAPCRPQRC